MRPQDRQIVIRCPAISIGSRVLWCILETYADRYGNDAWPCVKTLMRDSGCSEHWVEDHLKELSDWKLITRGKRQIGTGWPVNLYTLHIPQKDGAIISPKKEGTHIPQKKGDHQAPVPKASSTPKNIIRLPKPKNPPEEDMG